MVRFNLFIGNVVLEDRTAQARFYTLEHYKPDT
jgi:hypothetical protein